MREKMVRSFFFLCVSVDDLCYDVMISLSFFLHFLHFFFVLFFG